MRHNRFRPGDDAVSTVVGVVLLIGIAVVMMAAIGAFVLGFGPGDAPPESEIQFHQESGNVTVTIVRSAGLEAQNLEFRTNGTDACTMEGTDWDTSGQLDRGDSMTVRDRGGGGCPSGDSLPPNTVIQVIWESPSGGSSDILAEYEVI